MADHPEWSKEENTLRRVRRALAEELRVLEARRPTAGDRWAEQRIAAMRAVRAEALRNMIDEPYFGRLDVILEDDAVPHTFYIGKHDATANTVRIIDWRTPVGSLFYSGSARQQEYSTPGGERKSALLELKRQIIIESGVLRRIVDVVDWRGSGAHTTDEESFLIDQLSHRGELRLKDIVRTVQAEQNELIRRPPVGALVIQGVAGSGKTSVAYHRLAFLLYEGNKFRLKPSETLVLGPSSLFLSYASEVLPDLGIRDVRQTTFVDLALTQVRAERGSLRARKQRFKSLCEGTKSHQFVVDYSPLNAILSSRLSISRRQEVAAGSRVRGSLAMRELLQRYAERLTSDALGRIPTSAEALPNPEETLNEVLSRATGLSSRERDILRELTSELLRPEAVLDVLKTAHSLPIGAARVRMFRKLSKPTGGASPGQKGHRDYLSVLLDQHGVASSDHRGRLREKYEIIVERYLDRLLPPIDAHDTYYKLLTREDLLRNLASGLLDSAQVEALLSRRPPGRSTVYADDVGPILSLHFELYGVWVADANVYSATAAGEHVPEPRSMRIRHLVLDEGQDLSPLEYSLLRDLVGSGSMTILGDISQGIYAHKGISSWEEVFDTLGHERVSFEEILRSYRSTVEIVRFCNEILRTPDGYRTGLAVPFKRHGDRARVVVASSEEEMLQLVVDRVSELVDYGYSTIAVVCRTVRQRRAIASRLRGAVEARVEELTAGSAVFDVGVSVLTAADAKGLEFEAVVVTHATPQDYPETDGLAQRLLYVACTRALHSLDVYSYGDMTALLRYAQREADIVTAAAGEESVPSTISNKLPVSGARSIRGGEADMSPEELEDRAVMTFVQEGISQASQWKTAAELEYATRSVPCMNWKAIVAWVLEVGPYAERLEAMEYLGRIPQDRQSWVLRYIMRHSASPQLRERAQALYERLRHGGMEDYGGGWWHGP